MSNQQQSKAEVLGQHLAGGKAPDPARQALANMASTETAEEKMAVGLVNIMKKEIEKALPAHMKNNSDRYARQFVTLIRQNPELATCEPSSLLISMMTASALGLDPSPVLGQCYIIPFRNSKKIGNRFVQIKEATFVLGYKGMIDLAGRGNRVSRITADVVRERDQFTYRKGLHGALEHVPSDEEDAGEIIYGYALAEFTNGGYVFEVWPTARIEAHGKQYSKTYSRSDSLWQTNKEAAYKKTMIRQIWKYLPISIELQKAINADEVSQADLSLVQKEGDVIDVLTLRPAMEGKFIEEIPEEGGVADPTGQEPVPMPEQRVVSEGGRLFTEQERESV